MLHLLAEALRRQHTSSWWYPGPAEADGRRHYCWCSRPPEVSEHGFRALSNPDLHEVRCREAREMWRRYEVEHPYPRRLDDYPRGG